MLATDPTIALRIPVLNPTRSLLTSTTTCCFDSGVTRSRPSFFVGPTLSLNSINTINMQLLRRTGYYNSPRLKVEAEIGGEDLFNAAATDKRAPRHLVIMVNGITGSASDWRYAAEQFVKRLPDKVIVHLNAILQD